LHRVTTNSSYLEANERVQYCYMYHHGGASLLTDISSQTEHAWSKIVHQSLAGWQPESANSLILVYCLYLLPNEVCLRQNWSTISTINGIRIPMTTVPARAGVIERLVAQITDILTLSLY